MEATTLDDAVDSLLATPEASGEDNLRDAADTMVEPTLDAESNTVEEVEDDDDVVEASDDDGEYAEEDDATEYTDEVEAVDENSEQMFDITIDGKQERWTLSQLKQSAAGQGYIQQKMRENAEAQKKLQEYEAQLAQRQEQVLQLAQQMQQGGLQPPTPPSRELFDSDPIGYMEQKLKYDEAVVDYNQKAAELQRVAQERQHRTQAQQQAYREEQARLLAEAIPEIVSPERSEKIKTELFDTGLAYGFSEAEMANVVDHRYIKALNDARKWRALQANKGKAQAKGENKPVVKSGAKRRDDGNAVTRKKAQQKLRQSGSIEDALNLMLDK